MGSTYPPIKCIAGPLSPVIKGPEREADLSPPSIVEVKNEYSCIPSPLICIRGMHRDFKLSLINPLFCSLILVSQYYAVMNAAAFITDVATLMYYVLLQELHFLTGRYASNPVKYSDKDMYIPPA